MSLPTKMHMAAGGDSRAMRALAMRFINDTPVAWKRASLCGKYLRLELTTEDWAKVDCKMCLKVKGARR